MPIVDAGRLALAATVRLGPTLDLSRPSPRLQATPSFAEREEWMHALNEAACEVSKLFRDSAGRAERAKALDAAKAVKQASEEVTQVL